MSVAFTGTLNAGTITGTLTISQLIRPTNPNLLPGGANGPNAFSGTGGASYAMTLR